LAVVVVDIDDTSFYQHMAEVERLVRRIKTADNTEECYQERDWSRPLGSSLNTVED